MEQLTVCLILLIDGFVTIDLIPQDRSPTMLQMHANLVRSAGGNNRLDQTELTVPFKSLKRTDRYPTVWNHGHLLAKNWMSSNRNINLAFFWTSNANSQVLFINLSRSKELNQLLLS